MIPTGNGYSIIYTYPKTFLNFCISFKNFNAMSGVHAQLQSKTSLIILYIIQILSIGFQLNHLDKSAIKLYSLNHH